MGTEQVAEGPGAPGGIVVELVDWLRQLASSGGSDLHIKVGSPPGFREGGWVRRLDHPPLHIVTIEDPIEVLHSDKVAWVNQREVGQDSRTFLTALRAALRQDPDVILIGEMRDTETVQAALQAAETGHLVLSTLHTTNATETVNRVVDFFPPHQQQQVRLTIAGSLRGIVSQRLVPATTGGRVQCTEILVN